PVSFEFYPPKTPEQHEQLERTVTRLRVHAPQFVSVTFGAGGSTLSYTPDTVRALREVHGLEAVPHLSCMGGTRSEIAALLEQYRDIGCTRVVALRGDLPSGMATSGDFRYAADLVRFIRSEHDRHFHITVAAYPETHPQAEDAHADVRHFVAKIEAGADNAITQYFFNHRCLFPLRRGCAPRRRERAGRARHHAGFQLCATAALLRAVRRRNPALDRAPHAGLWR
ncbi:5,10-methylenetetrahydrofolate reductase, partial [mine drainage metagenome]